MLIFTHPYAILWRYSKGKGNFLAVYMHHFKREAKICNLKNNAVTIRILVKGLKNVYSLAAQIYENGPQTLADAISEVKKLQATQQLTATLIPSSTVNVCLMKRIIVSSVRNQVIYHIIALMYNVLSALNTAT